MSQQTNNNDVDRAVPAPNTNLNRVTAQFPLPPFLLTTLQGISFARAPGTILHPDALAASALPSIAEVAYTHNPHPHTEQEPGTRPASPASPSSPSSPAIPATPATAATAATAAAEPPVVLFRRDPLIPTPLQQSRDHKCPHCLWSFASAWELRRHLLSIHGIAPETPEPNVRKHKCPVENCARSFDWLPELTRHRLSAHNLEPPPPTEEEIAKQKEREEELKEWVAGRGERREAAIRRLEAKGIFTCRLDNCRKSFSSEKGRAHHEKMARDGRGIKGHRKK
ncbi:uncharacterized protein LY89DRAFT_763744 [Mollisia scopiformis]|uniref:C2H2-type domain-containing protein n=1 Tax=Mollisia scopiformis TaxID=149040 RepID=A0A132B9Q8_MOLSC|nr:uncharacterized protein LY89DRAFT_763744 [Mollisia scopiformis]KUJ09140.1 hypothetical protein LY89DRAFT_763744 [Mollisia scopiformis]